MTRLAKTPSNVLCDENAFPNSFVHASRNQQTPNAIEMCRVSDPLLVLLLLLFVGRLLVVLLLALAPDGALEAGANTGNGLANRLS